MSYGWLTESSLIPQPAKEIRGVSSLSLLTLSDVIAKKEDESRRRQELTNSTRTRPTRKPQTWVQRQLEEENWNVDKRRRLDLPEGVSRPAEAPLEESRRRLQEKARLYEALVDGRPVDSADSSRASSVLDLELKRWQREDERLAALKQEGSRFSGATQKAREAQEVQRVSAQNSLPGVLRSRQSKPRRHQDVAVCIEEEFSLESDTSGDEDESAMGEGKMTKALWDSLSDDSRDFLKELWTPQEWNRRGCKPIEAQEKQFRREEVMRLMLMYASQKISEDGRRRERY